MRTKKETELLDLGIKVQALFDSGYVNRKQALWLAFLKGILSGFGAVIGGTIVVALVLWFLSSLQELPFIGPISNSLQTSIQQKHR
ncbi:MAG TPA: DUF5665 domain-containing protein [Candidatus Acidoferrum sp.]|nr:DUF5665 domain-containing protein [Candidatus Acidoferrum sp.]